MGKIGFGLLIVCALACACVPRERSYFYPPDMGSRTEQGEMSLADPGGTVVVLFTTGSAVNDESAACPEGAGTPPVLKGLAGQSVDEKRIVVVGYCPSTVGKLAAGISMSEARAPELEGVVRSFLALGVPPRQIFVAGQSMGGWAAVLVGARSNVPIGGVIAFAPANGIWERQLRRPEHWRAFARQKTALEQVKQLNALVYTFARDNYNQPEDLEFMKKIAGVRYVVLDRDTLADGSCSGRAAHSTARTTCFATAEHNRILQFIEERLRATE